MRTQPKVLVSTALALVVALTACSPAASPTSAPPQSDASRGESAGSLSAATSPAGAAAQANAPRAAAPAAKPAAQPGKPGPAPAPSTDLKAAQAAGRPDEAPGISLELPPVTNLGRMIIYTTDLTLLLEDLASFPARAGALAAAQGGYVAGTETKDENGIQTLLVRLKVPPQKYDETMRGLRGLAVDVRGEKAATRDVTEEFSDTQTQIASLEAAHAQLLELQKRATTLEDIVKIQQQAAQVKLQIDRLKGRATSLDRQAEFATITAKAQPVGPVIQRDFVTERSALRKAEANRASLEAQLKRVRTPEEEVQVRDKLSEALLDIARREERLATLTRQAAASNVNLPTAESLAVASRVDETLPREYIDTRVQLRRAEYARTELTAALQAGKPGVTSDDLTHAILEVGRLTAQLTVIQERAKQANITLPTLTPEQEATLAGVPSSAVGPIGDPFASVRRGWDASLTVLLGIATVLATGLAFAWWLLLPLIAVAAIVLRRRGMAAGGAFGPNAAPQP